MYKSDICCRTFVIKIVVLGKEETICLTGKQWSGSWFCQYSDRNRVPTPYIHIVSVEICECEHFHIRTVKSSRVGIGFGQCDLNEPLFVFQNKFYHWSVWLCWHDCVPHHGLLLLTWSWTWKWEWGFDCRRLSTATTKKFSWKRATVLLEVLQTRKSFNDPHVMLGLLFDLLKK